MKDHVKNEPGATRAYNAQSRRSQAAENRRTVLEVARELFVANGYVNVSVSAVARAAGVSVETIYKTVGPKPALLKAVSDSSIAGDDEPVTLEQRAFVQQTIAEPDPAVKLHRYATLIADTQPRLAPVAQLVRQAALTDAGAAEVWRTMTEERLTGAARFAAHLYENDLLRQGVDADTARDLLWTYNSLELYELLVLGREWNLPAYQQFLAQALIAALLPHP